MWNLASMMEAIQFSRDGQIIDEALLLCLSNQVFARHKALPLMFWGGIWLAMNKVIFKGTILPHFEMSTQALPLFLFIAINLVRLQQERLPHLVFSRTKLSHS